MSRSESRSNTYGFAITEMAAEFAPELPDRPEPDQAEVDESDWLFDSGRDYLEQLAMYKARKSGE